MIDPGRLLTALQTQRGKLEADLRQQVADQPELAARLQADFETARNAGRTAATLRTWTESEITQGAVAWLLACAFLRFAEDNALIATPLLSGPGDALRRAKDAAREYFHRHPTEHERHYLHHCFDQMAELPAVAGLFDRAHNPLFALPPSPEGAAELVAFWQQVDPDSGALRFDFTDPRLDTRFLGDLYQEFSEAARKRYALLQTPEFVEAFILERTLEPAIGSFGLEGIRLIDPTCGSGHFLLGAFHRLLAHWQKVAPGLDARERVIHALAAVHGVDVNPFAVAIARFRLLVAALHASGIRTLKEAPGWRFNVTAGDSLLHGRRFGQLDLGGDDLQHCYPHAYAAEDIDEINRILGQQYHAVVGNPPYITASDSALNRLYRARYASCHRKFSLGVPFTERFFQLAVEDGNGPAGFVGLITANSFMKREFGKKLIEDYLPRQGLTHVIDTSGAYIPGHGTPTVILFGRNRRPVVDTVRAVLGIRGEPSTPEDPAQGLVWSSIVDLLDQPGHENGYVSVAAISRERLAQHPWSLQGGSTPDVLTAINDAAQTTLSERVTDIGFGSILGEDDAFMVADATADRRRDANCQVRLLVEGDRVRDWGVSPATEVLFPYDEHIALVPEVSIGQQFWPLRMLLWARNDFGGKTYRMAGRAYWSYHQIPVERNRIPLSITFAFVATHNHFVLDRGGKVFNRTAPVIKLPVDAGEDAHLGLLGLLNSSTACFWMKQIFQNRGSTVDARGARQTTVEFENFYEFTGTGLKQFPLPADRPLQLTRQLDQLTQQRTASLPAALAPRLPLSRADLDTARDAAASLLARMIALQEELDWWCYRAYGLLDADLCFAGTPPEMQLGERAFEIVLARRIEAGEVRSRWFERHGSTPITEVPTHWPADYRALVARRIEWIEASAWIDLLEKPEYKRRWNQPDWAELEQAALKTWLLDRLETRVYWPRPELRRLHDLAAAAERDAHWMQVAALYTGHPGFDIPALVQALVHDESMPALKVLRYQPSGLRKRADWEQAWALQRREDAIDAEIARANPRRSDEDEAAWRARIKPEQDRRKAAEVGAIPTPPKYTSADFLGTALWRLRGGLDVPKERFFRVPDPQMLGESLYGWAGWNPAERVQALAGACIAAEQGSGAELAGLIPLLAAIDEQLPWVRQWHNDVDPATDVRPGDYFTQWLGNELDRHGWTAQTLAGWGPEPATRRRRRA